MKEYLNKLKDGSYKLVVLSNVVDGHDGLIEIPEGAESYTTIGLRDFTLSFYKDNFRKYCNENTNFEWRESTTELSERKGFRVLWQRHTHPEELPFVDDEPSINDQYVEIERVRQSDKVLKEILEGNLPEFDFEEIDAFIESNIEQDNVNQPVHYCSHPSGIECIEITRHHDFAIGNAIKYLWRAGLKDSSNEIQDLEKSIWYIQDKINQLKK